MRMFDWRRSQMEYLTPLKSASNICISSFVTLFQIVVLGRMRCCFPRGPHDENRQTQTTFSYVAVVLVLRDDCASRATPHSDKRPSYSRVMNATVGTRAPLSVWNRGTGANEADWRL